MSEVTINHHEHVVLEESAQPRLSSFLHSATDATLFVLIFLLPLFYVMGLRDGIELPKQLLLLSLTTLAGIFWLARVFLSKSIALRRSYVFFPVLLLVVGVGVATALSLDRYTSLFGGALGEYASFATLIGMFLFLFFATSSLHDVVFVRRALIAFFASSLVLFLIVFLKLFGAPLPLMPAAATWSPFGSVFSLGLFSAGSVLLASGILLFDAKSHAVLMGGAAGRVLRIFVAVTGALGLVYLLLLDWWVAWVVVIVGAGLLLAVVFVYAQTFRNLARLALPLIGLVLAILFLFIRTPIRANFPVEIGPSQAISWEIAQDVLREHPSFGSGPATYSLSYATHRPDALTETQLWNVRFGRGASFVSTMFPTTGLVGGILWLLLVAVITGFVIRSFLRDRDQTTWLLTVALFFPWVGMVVARFLYGANMSIEFFFWFLTTLLVVATARRLSVFTFTKSPRALLGSSLGAVVFTVLMVILLLLGISRYIAWASFADALRANATGNLSGTREALVRAASFDGRTDVFMRNLAQARLVEASQSESIEELRTRLSAAVSAGQVAANLSPANAQNWALLGAIYREMAPVVTGAGELGLQAFGQARGLEPPNPIYPTEMGRLRMALADRARVQTESEDRTIRAQAESQMAEHLGEAGRLFEEAIALKQDYAPAHFYLAFTLDRQGKLPEAIGKMESVLNYNPRDIGAMFQLSLLYLKNNEIDNAEVQLTRALQLAPNYANAHWYLASIYEARGELDRARAAIETVLANNPENQAVQNRLGQLRAGRAGEGLPEPVGLPGQESSLGQ